MMTGSCPTAGNELFWDGGEWRVGGGGKRKNMNVKGVIQSCADFADM